VTVPQGSACLLLLVLREQLRTPSLATATELEQRGGHVTEKFRSNRLESGQSGCGQIPLLYPLLYHVGQLATVRLYSTVGVYL